MSTVVRVNCGDCGVSELRPDDLRLFTSPQVYESRYAFTCPQCRSWISRPCSPAVLHMLRQVRVPEQRQVPREVFEPHVGPPLTADEVLDFSLELGGVDDLARYACRR